MSSDTNRRIRVATTYGLKIGRAAIALVALALAVGGQPMIRPVAQAPQPPATHLLDAARLELPTDCAVRSGRSYRMSFTVGLGVHVLMLSILVALFYRRLTVVSLRRLFR